MKCPRCDGDLERVRLSQSVTLHECPDPECVRPTNWLDDLRRWLAQLGP